jgi:cell division protease FtsH
MLKILLINLCVLVNTFTFLNPLKRHKHGFTQLNYKKKDLKNIDIKIDLYKSKMKKLLQDRNLLFKNISGLKLHNENDIDKYLENIVNNKNFYIDDDDDEDEYVNIEDEIDDDEEIDYNNNDLNKPKYKIYFHTQNTRGNINKDENIKSENFEIIKNSSCSFKDIGGYELIKEELLQCADMLVNYTKYSKYNVRTPKGLILEGPPGNGKTLLAKSFSGEIKVNFIPVSGAQFQEKFVGVGASRIRELFKLACENLPCIIFIDELDALGRHRSTETSNNVEHDSTLNELLVNLDGFKSTNGIFIIGATNRIDLLDAALIRPGRIDKKIYVGNPDQKTREFILNIHMKGKPIDSTIKINELIEMTNGFSGAQIENLLNEAMLFTLRSNRTVINREDFGIISNRILVGFQSTENKLTQEMLFQVAVHEMGHALVGLFTKYKKLVRVTINLWSPKSLGFTLFEPDETNSNLITKEGLISQLMVLLGGRVAEEIFFDKQISSGASHDLEQTKKIAENMIVNLGMGYKVIFPSGSDKYKEMIDKEIEDLIGIAYQRTRLLLLSSETLLKECAELLVIEHEIKPDTIIKKIKNRYPYLERNL